MKKIHFIYQVYVKNLSNNKQQKNQINLIVKWTMKFLVINKFIKKILHNNKQNYYQKNF